MDTGLIALFDKAERAEMMNEMKAAIARIEHTKQSIFFSKRFRELRILAPSDHRREFHATSWKKLCSADDTFP